MRLNCQGSKLAPEDRLAEHPIKRKLAFKGCGDESVWWVATGLEAHGFHSGEEAFPGVRMVLLEGLRRAVS